MESAPTPLLTGVAEHCRHTQAPNKAETQTHTGGQGEIQRWDRIVAAYLCFGVDLGPDVVRKIEDVARVKVEGAAAEHKAIGPLAAAAAPRVQKAPRIVVPREAVHMAAHLARVVLHTACEKEEEGVGRCKQQ